MNRKEFFEYICVEDNYKQIEMAYDLSKTFHKGQIRRFNGERYFEHPRRVAMSVSDYVIKKDRSDAVCVALLHDILEDTFISPRIIENLFSYDVYSSILDLSKYSIFVSKYGVIDKIERPEQTYWEEIQNSNIITRTVKVCDRLDNLSDLFKFSTEKRQRYIQETEKYVLPIAESLGITLGGRLVSKIRQAINF